jgi:hypothetical protein
MPGPNKKEVSQAARDLANPKTPKTQRSEAAETLNYRKQTMPQAKPPTKKG